METTMNKPMTGSTDMGSTMTKTVDDATSTAHKVIDQASEAARPAVERVAASAHQIVDRLAGAANTSADVLDERMVQLRDVHSRLTDQARDYVRENPLTAVAIAVATGVILSKLMSSR